MGPLAGIKVLELAGIGPGPFCAMLLADLGATVLRIDRPEPPELGIPRPLRHNLTLRGRRALALDLKRPEARDLALRLAAQADALIEGFRPGVTERLGLGPEDCLARNPRLVYGRMTGWGQEGPLAQAAGHDINYIAITGALDSFRAANGETVSPLNLVGDYGGGALYLVVGVLAGVIEARSSGKGQVVDAAMCDGVSSMLTMFHSMKATGRWTDQPRTNLLDGGAPFYRTYECKDGGFMAIGALEPQFYAELRKLAGLSEDCYDAQMDRKGWPNLHEKMTALFKSKTRDEWSAILEGSDACAAAVRGLFDAPSHPHLAARKTFVNLDGHVQPAPAPRFSLTPSNIQGSPAVPPVDAAEILSQWSQPAAAKAS